MTIAPPSPQTGSPLIIDDAQLIGGDWVPAANGQTIDVINPATGEVLGRVPRGDAADVDAAVRAAEAAYPAWRDTNATTRGALIFRWAQLID
jgi:aldehyde dehydrogenase (NAD+)